MRSVAPELTFLRLHNWAFILNSNVDCLIWNGIVDFSNFRQIHNRIVLVVVYCYLRAVSRRIRLWILLIHRMLIFLAKPAGWLGCKTTPLINFVAQKPTVIVIIFILLYHQPLPSLSSILIKVSQVAPLLNGSVRQPRTFEIQVAILSCKLIQAFHLMVLAPLVELFIEVFWRCFYFAVGECWGGCLRSVVSGIYFVEGQVLGFAWGFSLLGCGRDGVWVTVWVDLLRVLLEENV